MLIIWILVYAGLESERWPDLALLLFLHTILGIHNLLETPYFHQKSQNYWHNICFDRKYEPAFRYLHFILCLSSAGVLSCHLVWFMDVPVGIAHLLLSLAQHYLWLVSSLASIIFNTKCCKVVRRLSHISSGAYNMQHNFSNAYDSRYDSLAEQYVIIFVLPLLYMAPLPIAECFCIHK